MCDARLDHRARQPGALWALFNQVGGFDGKAYGHLFPAAGSAGVRSAVPNPGQRRRVQWHCGAEKLVRISEHGNVECSVQLETSIATMPADRKLRGYRQQIDGLKKYSDIAEVPPDPYDIPTPLAYKLMGYYDLALNKD